MSLSEFELIQQYFNSQRSSREDVLLGIGDDGAVLQPPPHTALVVTTDTLVEGVHFFEDQPARELGYKALAVNLSDLAAMGALPAWMTLSLTLPAVDTTWLADFSQGLFELAERHQVQLVGGDTSRGPLSVSLTLMGFQTGRVMRRSGAQSGDGIYVTGPLGGAHRAVQALYARSTPLPADLQAFYRPTPRVLEGRLLSPFASAAIDISDGLAADLGHILAQSHVGAELDSAALTPFFQGGALDWEGLLHGGEDYELCVTVPPSQESEAVAALDGRLIRIGVITSELGLRLRDEHGVVAITPRGYQHFLA